MPSSCQKPSIIITVYDRRQHLKQCLESLESAVGSESFHVIVGSDSYAKESHCDNIRKVRKYLKEKQLNNGFAKLSVIFHEVNKGGRENSRLCHQLSKISGHTSFIRLEDDIVVGRHFLDYMCEGIKQYETTDDVVAICGYKDPSLRIAGKQPFLYNRFSAYGYGSWYQKWEKVQSLRESKNYAKVALSTRSLFFKQSKITANAKSYPFLAKKYYKAGDIELGLLLEIEKLWVLVPHVSLTANRGMDGSGLRSGRNDALQKMEPNHSKVHVPPPSSVIKVDVVDVRKSIPIANQLSNWTSYLVYNYMPYGFNILKLMRSFKKSMRP